MIVESSDRPGTLYTIKSLHRELTLLRISAALDRWHSTARSKGDLPPLPTMDGSAPRESSISIISANPDAAAIMREVLLSLWVRTLIAAPQIHEPEEESRCGGKGRECGIRLFLFLCFSSPAILPVAERL